MQADFEGPTLIFGEASLPPIQQRSRSQHTTTWYLHSHFVWLRLSNSSIAELPVVCLAAHGRKFRRWTPCKCQTSTASPAEPGGLPCRLGTLNQVRSQGALSSLVEDEAFFSIDELEQVAVKMRTGRSLQRAGKVRTVPQRQKSRGAFILTAALDLARNQIIYFFSERKNSDEIILLIDRLREDYSTYRKLFLPWDSAPWHSSARA